MWGSSQAASATSCRPSSQRWVLRTESSACGAVSWLWELWLNPSEWEEWVDEVVPGYPRGLIARTETAKMELRERTLTNLYDTRPQWLADAHAALDAAIAKAYGWDAHITEDDVLRELRSLNAATSVR